MAPSQLGIFTRSDATVATADLEYHVQPLSTDKLGDPLHPYPGGHGLGLQSAAGEPRHLPHPEPRPRRAARDPPELPERRARPATSPLACGPPGAPARRRRGARAATRPEELLPGPAVTADADLLRAIGDIATTIFHPVGTCRMGTDATPWSTTGLRVHGLDGLRIVDASIMPTIVSGNTASPVVMIAEKAADLIRHSQHQPW